MHPPWRRSSARPDRGRRRGSRRARSPGTHPPRAGGSPPCRGPRRPRSPPSSRTRRARRPRRRWARVIDDLALDVDRQPLALLDQRQEPAVGGVARGIDDARDADPIAGLERFDVGVRQRRANVLLLGGGLRPPSETSPPRWRRRSRRSIAVAHSVASLWRCAWHSMVTATGSDVMWQGYVSMWMPNDVVSPP